MNKSRLQHLLTWILGTALMWSASTWGCLAADANSAFNSFKWSVYLDESHQTDIQTVQQISFMPLDSNLKLPFSSSVVWLKLEEEQTTENSNDWFLKFLPSMLTEATVYTSSGSMANEWNVKTYSANALALPIEIESSPNRSPIYMKLISPWDFRLNLMVDVKAKIDLVQRRVDMFVIMVTTLMMLALVLAVIRLMVKFNWLSLGIAALSLCIPAGWISSMGMLPFLTGIDQHHFHRIFPIALIGGMVSFFFIWMVLATQLFKQGTWIKFLWGLWVVMATVWIGAFIDAIIAMQMIELIYTYGQWLCFSVLIIQAIQSRQHLKLSSEKLLFALLSIFMLMPYPNGSNLFKPLMTPFGMGEMPIISLLMLVRTALPLAILLLTAWTYDLLISQRVKKINHQLSETQDALDKESARLKQQKQFIAMLTHELKNPLMASAMALGSIRQRLHDESSLKRINAISYSLDEIDGIIERCSEIDKYEQGYIPVNVDPFTLGTLLSVLKNAQTSERIYTIVRGCDEHQLINSDIYYVKAILKNLLKNAEKYATPESLVEFIVEASQEDKQASIVFTISNEVEPEGAPDHQMVFQRYYRSELAKQQSGAGLGLWLAQSMAGALGTKIVYAYKQHTVSFHFAIKV